VSNYFLGSYNIKKKAFYSSLGHSSTSSLVVQSTDSRQPFVCLCEQFSNFTVQKSEELSIPFVLAHHGAREFSLRCRHSYASVISPPSPHLRESGADPYSDAPKALCSSASDLASTNLTWSD